jgi:hypothetical protein
MKHIIKTFVTLLAISLLASACSRKSAETPAAAGHSQFTFAAGDLASPVEVATNRFGTFTVGIKLSGVKADELRHFTQTHLNQQVEILFGSKVLMSPMIRDVISNGEVQVSFAPSDTNAQAVVDSLNKR